MRKIKIFLERYWIGFFVGIVGAVVAEFAYFTSLSASVFMDKFYFRRYSIVLDTIFLYLPLVLVYVVALLAQNKFSRSSLRAKFFLLLFSFLSFSAGVIVGELAFAAYFVASIHLFGFS